MKHNYKINIDRPLPSDEQISRHKDFGRILADYHNLTQPIYRVPLYKNPKAFLGLVFIATVALLVFWAVEQEDKDLEKAKKQAELPVEIRMAEENSFLKAPLPALQVPKESYAIDVTKPQTLTMNDGTQLTIPAHAFEDGNHEPIRGVAHLHVRRIHSVAEIIASGMPMQLEGQSLRPEGIFEIDLDLDPSTAKEPIALSEGQSITIEMPVSQSANAAQLYWLDLSKRSWIAQATPVTAQVRNQNVASINPNDGFGVVEYDAEGNIIPKNKPAIDSAQAPIKVMKFNIDHFGVVCLGNAITTESSNVTSKVRFTDPSNQTLRMLTLYAVDRTSNTVKFLWPKTADFVFDLDIAPGAKTDYIGFLPDGRLGMAQNVVAMPNTPEVHILQMKISDAPVQNIKELTQLIDQPAGLLE
jgi:hypothetical protein